MAHPLKHSRTVHLQIGKNGITESAVEELRRQLKSGDVAVKFLKAFTQEHDRKDAAAELAERCEARIESFVGGKLILSRKR